MIIVSYGYGELIAEQKESECTYKDGKLDGPETGWDDPKKREELAEACSRNIQTKDSAILLIELLKDPKSEVRRKAISGLRRLSSRIRRSGETRILRPSDFSRDDAETLTRIDTKSVPRISRKIPLAGGPDFAPKVQGLVPHLIKAASDEDESNRILAMYALADTRDPLAQVELRNRLRDPSERVRFEAACLLSEFRDASGLSEMKASLRKFQTDTEDERRSVLYYTHVERLLSSFERITGKSMGAIPPDPGLISDSSKWPEIRERHASLLDNWTAWWDWQPAESAKTRKSEPSAAADAASPRR